MGLQNYFVQFPEKLLCILGQRIFPNPKIVDWVMEDNMTPLARNRLDFDVATNKANKLGTSEIAVIKILKITQNEYEIDFVFLT